MRFWDASALLPLILREPGSDLARRWLRDDPDVVVWSLTRLELTSAIERRAREGTLRRSDRTKALARVERLSESAHEVLDVLAVRSRGAAILGRHALRAADSAQLGAAQLVAEGDASSLTFVALDRRLADAAIAEGFHVLTWPDTR